jgi:cytochrome c biogenesis protein CcmG/thiol:disulfide interchange protein DsbE
MPTTLARRPSLALAAGLLAAGFGAAPAGAKDAVLKPWPADQATPPLELVDLEGKPWKLEQLRGKVVVVNFWATWCGPCVQELPVLGALARQGAQDGLAVVGVNYKEGMNAVGDFVAAHPIPYPVLRDRSGEAFKLWSPGVMPATIVVDRQGRARWRTVGEIPPEDKRLRAVVGELLAEPPAKNNTNR